MEPRTAVIYCRISRDREGAALGVDRQRADCEALAARLGWEVVGIHTDNDLSSYSGKISAGLPGPAPRSHLRGAGDGPSRRVALHRSRGEWTLVDLSEEDVVAGTVAGRARPLHPSGRANARSLGVWARFESEHKSDRIKRAHQQSAEAGLWRGGGRPFGYLDDADDPAPGGGPAIQRAYQQLLAGQSTRSIIRGWNDAGLTSVRGKPWVHVTFTQVILRERNYGASMHRGEAGGSGTGSRWSTRPPGVASTRC